MQEHSGHKHNPALIEAARAKGSPVGYSLIWDRYYLKDSGVWLEPMCGDESCECCRIAPDSFRQYAHA